MNKIVIFVIFWNITIHWMLLWHIPTFFCSKHIFSLKNHKASSCICICLELPSALHSSFPYSLLCPSLALLYQRLAYNPIPSFPTLHGWTLLRWRLCVRNRPYAKHAVSRHQKMVAYSSAWLFGATSYFSQHLGVRLVQFLPRLYRDWRVVHLDQSMSRICVDMLPPRIVQGNHMLGFRQKYQADR